MTALLEIDNFAANNLHEKSYVEVASDATDTTLTVKSDENISTNLYALIGQLADETSELCLITGIAADVLTLSPALANAHSRYDDVTILEANQIRVYRAANVDGSEPDDGDFTLLATVDIDTDNLQTSYTDSSGGSDYWYKFTYYNSASSDETTTADSQAVRGGAVNVYATIEQIRVEAGVENNPYMSDAFVDEQRIEAQDVINTALQGTYTVPFEAPIAPIIERCTKLLAAGYILKKDYGDGAVGTNSEGQAKIDEVIGTKDKKGLLQGIIDGTSGIIDGTGAAVVDRQKVHGFPLSTTKDLPLNEGGSTRAFRMGMRF